MLQLTDLAGQPDFQVGQLTVSPSRRLVEGPAGNVHLEPRIMQVFLLLLDHRGQVVTRNKLFDQCWGGAMVGDDSLNRAIAKVRRIAADVAPGHFNVETIPRTGYRLTGAESIGESTQDIAPSVWPDNPGPALPATSRRMVLGGVIAAAAVGVPASGKRWHRARTIVSMSL